MFRAATDSIGRTLLTFRRFKDHTRACSPTCARGSFSAVLSYDDRMAFGSLDRCRHFFSGIRTCGRMNRGRSIDYKLEIGPRCSRVRIRLCGPYTPNSHFNIVSSRLPRRLPINVRKFRYRYRYRDSSCTLRRALRRLRAGFKG